MQLIGVADTCANFLVIQKHSKTDRASAQCKTNLQLQHRRLAQQSCKRRPGSLQCFLKPPKPSTPIRLFHIKIPECKLKKKNISLLAPSPSTSPSLALVTSYLIPQSRPSDGCTFIVSWLCKLPFCLVCKNAPYFSCRAVLRVPAEFRRSQEMFHSHAPDQKHR